ncbi:hypothetical protein HT031_004785 [Scenedesmus sp. PABB004]|nr:hypothetical protein HT031_004785 [Scenedesmus sp. PABB004]
MSSPPPGERPPAPPAPLSRTARTAGEANSSRQRASGSKHQKTGCAAPDPDCECELCNAAREAEMARRQELELRSKQRRQIGLSLAQWKRAARLLRLDLPEQLLAGVTVLCVLNACLLALHGLGLGDERLATFFGPACPEHMQVRVPLLLCRALRPAAARTRCRRPADSSCCSRAAQVFAAAIAAATAARWAAKAGPAGDKAQCLDEAAVTARLLPLLHRNIWSIIKAGVTIWNGEADRPDCSAPPPTVKACPKCRTVIANRATKCPDCKHDMIKEKRTEQRRHHLERIAEDMGIELLLAGLDGVEDTQLPRWGNRKSESNICKDAMARFDTTLALFDVSIHTRIVVLSKNTDTWDERTPLFTTTGESVALVSDFAIPQFGYKSKTRRVFLVSFVGIGQGAYIHLKKLPRYAEIVKAQVSLSQRAAQLHLQFLEASAGRRGEGGSGEADDGQRGEVRGAAPARRAGSLRRVASPARRPPPVPSPAPRGGR